MKEKMKEKIIHQFSGQKLLHTRGTIRGFHFWGAIGKNIAASAFYAIWLTLTGGRCLFQKGISIRAIGFHMNLVMVI